MKYVVPQIEFFVQTTLSPREIMLLHQALSVYREFLSKSDDPSYEEWEEWVFVLESDFVGLLEEIPDHFCDWL